MGSSRPYVLRRAQSPVHHGHNWEVHGVGKYAPFFLSFHANSRRTAEQTARLSFDVYRALSNLD